MTLFDSMNISSLGLSANRVRMNVISSNIANTHTTRTQEGIPYRRKRVFLQTQNHYNSFKNTLKEQLLQRGVASVKVRDVIEDRRAFISKYDPTHPDADERGYVKMPNINIMEEMTEMIIATRSYEANVTAFNAAKGMALKALEMGK